MSKYRYFMDADFDGVVWRMPDSGKGEILLPESEQWDSSICTLNTFFDATGRLDEGVTEVDSSEMGVT